MMGFDFTDAVRRSLSKAREEAVRLHHEYVGTEHMLLGLLAYDDTVAAAVLKACDVDVQAMALMIETTVKRGILTQQTGPDLPYTSRSKKVLEEAMAEAAERGHRRIGTEHLMLGMLREQKGIAAQILNEFGVTYEVAYRETSKAVTDEGSTEHVHRGPQLRAMSPSASSGALHAMSGGKLAAALLQDAVRSPKVAAVFAAHKIDVPRLIADLDALD